MEQAEISILLLNITETKIISSKLPKVHISQELYIIQLIQINTKIFNRINFVNS